MYEPDDPAIDDPNLKTARNGRPAGIVYEGFILKGSEAGTDSFLSVATKSFKRRWMSLRQELDGTCMLEFHKGPKKLESKGAICLDFCSQLVKNSRRSKFAFELRMSEGHKTCVLAAENEMDYDRWLDALDSALCSRSPTSPIGPKGNPKGSSDNSSPKTGRPDLPNEGGMPLLPKFGTLRKIERQDSDQELIKYSHENEYIVGQQRKEQRLNVCTLYPDLYLRKGAFVELSVMNDQRTNPYDENLGFRFSFACQRIEFNLKNTIDGGGSGLVEPLFTSVAVYDVRRGKLTEEMKFDVNDVSAKQMLSRLTESTDASTNGNSSANESEDPDRFTDQWVMNPSVGIFSIHQPSPDMFLVMRIEKIFSGAISSTSEAYLKSAQNGSIDKLSAKLHKSAKATCQKMTHLYRMPFAWAAKPLLRPGGQLDTDSDFGSIYRQDGHKLSDDDLLKHLFELRNSERPKNVTQIPGRIRVLIEPWTAPEAMNVINSSHVPVRPFARPIAGPATVEVQEFLAADPCVAYPFTSFANLLYVYPRHLRYDAQKLFPKAKNICCAIEFRDSDSALATPRRNIFGSAGQGQSEFVTRVITSVTYHNNNPEFYEEIKLQLPCVLHERHHLLFSFFHVSSSSLMNKKKEGVAETPIGYAWMPIYPAKGRLAIEETSLSISTHLPPGYLSYKPLGLGHGFSGPEIKWLDGGRESFKVEFRLVSSVFPADSNLHSFFVHVDKMLNNNGQASYNGADDSIDETVSSESSGEAINGKRQSICSDAGREISKFVQIQNVMPKLLKNLQEASICDLIRFFPLLMTQLLKLLMTTTSGDVSQHIVRSILHVLSSLDHVAKEDVVQTYVQYVFADHHLQVAGHERSVTLHEELLTAMVALLRSSNVDFIVLNKLLAHCGFFFRLLVKSMVCHLLRSNRIKMHRKERFSLEVHDHLLLLVDLLVPEIMRKVSLLGKETRHANHALAHLIARLFSIVDRGFVFKMIKRYLDKFHESKDSIPLHTYKFEFLAIVSAYEHYVPLNLPINFNALRALSGESLSSNSSLSSTAPPDNVLAISETFCRNHFLTGVLLRELRSALSEVHQVRGMALSVLRNLVVKHSVDQRYHQNTFQQTRIASLYLPFISLIVENLNRIHITGCYNSYLPLLTSSIPRFPSSGQGNNAGTIAIGSAYDLAVHHSNGSSVQMHTRHSSISTVGSATFSAKRVSFTDKFASLNSETSSLLVQSLRRNSSLETPLNNATAGSSSSGTPGGSSMRDSAYLNLIAGTTQLNPTLISNELLKLRRSTQPESGERTGDDHGDLDANTLRSVDADGMSLADSRSSSPYSRSSSHSSTATLTAVGITGPTGHEQSQSSTASPNLTSPTDHRHHHSQSSPAESQSNTFVNYSNHHRSHSLPIRFDKLNSKEVRDLLITFLWISKHANEPLLAGWARQANDNQLIQLLTIIEMCLHEFKYSPKRVDSSPLAHPSSSPGSANRSQTLSSNGSGVGGPGPAFWKTNASKSEKSMTLPSKIGQVSTIRHAAGDSCGSVRGEPKESEKEDLFGSLLEANLATETGLIALDLLSLLSSTLHSRLESGSNQPSGPTSPTDHAGNSGTSGESNLMRKLFHLHLTFFQFKQSEKLLQHLFASLRQFVARFSNFLFAVNVEHIGALCPPLLRLCSSRLCSVRSDASVLLYLLLRANFVHSNHQHIARMRLQLIISLSQLLGTCNAERLNNARFQESLSMIGNYARTDKSIGSNHMPRFGQLIKELIRSIRSVLTATLALRLHSDDSEKLLDLQLQLADGYKSTSPALRRTWLEAMASNHIQAGHLSEAAACYAHISALEYECLRLSFNAQHASDDSNADQSLSATTTSYNALQFNLAPIDFGHISPNINLDEKRPTEDQQLSADVRSSLELQFSEPLLVRSLRTAIEIFARAERYEVVPEVYKVLLPLFERHKDHETLAGMHQHIAETYRKVVTLQKSGKRYLGTYYRVAFFGREYFADDSGREFIYKEEKVTSLPEISQRLDEQFSRKHGRGNIKLIQSEREIDEKNDCDPRYGYIQITHVVPYHADGHQHLTQFEKEHNVNRFMFETPFCLSDPRKNRSSSCEDQAKRRTICQTSRCFPYVVKRVPVIDKQAHVLSPIEVAIDEMKSRVLELQRVIFQDPPDLKRLHLTLGGSISVQVNAGPLAYAKAFINRRHSLDDVRSLRDVYRDFVAICEIGLQLNERLIGAEQQQYHESLKMNFKAMVEGLCEQCSEFAEDNFDVESGDGDSDGTTNLINRSFRIFDFIGGHSSA